MNTLTLATLNIAAGSKDRVRQILNEWIVPTNFDVYVITETSDGPGTALLISEFRDAGWATFHLPKVPGDRGVAIATQVAGVLAPETLPKDSVPGRSLVLRLNTQPSIELIGMYVPNRGNDLNKRQRKFEFLKYWMQNLCLPAQPDVQRVILGDLNVVPLTQRPIFLPQERFEYDWFRKLTSTYFYDAAVVHGEGHESTWEAHTGEGYTYDHILPERTLLSRVREFRYDHSTRKHRILTDHSAVILTLEIEEAKRLAVRRFGESRQLEMF